MAKQNDDPEQKVLNALQHPLRRSIMRNLARRQGAPLSPLEVSRELRENLSTVSYHVRVLDRCDAVILVDTEYVRGSVKHFYRPCPEFMAHPSVPSLLGLSG